MNTRLQPYALLVTLLLVAALGAGCQPAIGALELPTVAARPTSALTGIVQVGNAEEVLPSNAQLDNWPLDNIRVDGDVLLATVGTGDQTRVVAVNLRSKEIAGLNDPLVAKEQWAITQRYFVWSQMTAGGINEELYVYDLLDGKKIAVRGEDDSQRWPNISGNIVVWAEIHGNRSWDIYAYDLSSHQLMPVVTRASIQTLPKIEEKWIVYLQRTGSDPINKAEELYLHNLTTGEDVLLGFPPPYTSDCEGCTYSIAKGRVVWVGWMPDQPIQWPPHLYVYDPSARTPQEVDMSKAACPSQGFSLGGSLMKWACSPQQMAGYDLEQQVFFNYPAVPEAMRGKAKTWTSYLSENWIVWNIEDRGEDIWVYITPGASKLITVPASFTPTPSRHWLFVAPIRR